MCSQVTHGPDEHGEHHAQRAAAAYEGDERHRAGSERAREREDPAKNLLWENFTKKGKAKRLRTLLSTLPGKHGKVASKTEVPRRPLLEALEKETTLLNTHDYPLGHSIRLSEKIIIRV